LLRLAIACYPAPLRLTLDAHCSPKKTQFITFRGIDDILQETEELIKIFVMSIKTASCPYGINATCERLQNNLALMILDPCPLLEVKYHVFTG
jgi:hypothetical protein